MKSHHPQHEDLDDDMPCGYIDTDNPWVRFFAVATICGGVALLIAGVTIIAFIIKLIIGLVWTIAVSNVNASVQIVRVALFLQTTNAVTSQGVYAIVFVTNMELWI